MSQQKQAPLPRQEFQEWLENAAVPVLVLQKGKHLGSVVKVPATPEIDYLFGCETFYGERISWSDRLEFCGLYDRQHQALHLLDDPLPNFVSGLTEEECQDSTAFGKRIAQEVDRYVEAAISNERSRLSVRELTSERNINSYRYYKGTEAGREAASLVFSGEKPDVQFHSEYYTSLTEDTLLSYPILSDLYKLIEQEYREYDGNCHQLYTAELLQEILLGLHSMCQGAEAQFFNGHTNVTSSRFIVFGVKGLLQASKNVRGAMLFNILSYMSDRLLTIGNTTAALDELYVWLSDNVSVGTTIIEYIRNTLKRVRKKESNLIMASQNLEDFDREGIRELTKPLFAIPPHQFIFNCGSIDKRFYMDLLQLEEAEYNLIRFPQRGVCLFKCGNERYLLEVHAPAYKEALFGTAGGR